MKTDKTKRIVLLIISILIIMFCGITYSIFLSGATFKINNQNLAKFIFDSKPMDVVELELTNLKPGDTKEFLFSVTNSENTNISDVTIEYEITIKTYHFLPLNINLFKLETDESETPIGECDESYSRFENALLCNMPWQTMEYAMKKLDNYKLVVEFPSSEDNPIYAELVDFIDLEIKSWQKT